MNNKTAIITGAAKRIGAAITRELHGMGMDVIIHYKNSEAPANQLARDLNNIRPDSARIFQADLSTPESCNALVDFTLAFNGRIDVLINNASAFFPTEIEHISVNDWDNLMDINLKTPLFLSKTAATHLAAAGGNIINLTDVYAEKPRKQYILYCISKSGLNMLTRALALELAPLVRVNAIAPGAIIWHEKTSEIDKIDILQKIPMNKTGATDDIASAVRYLVESASYTTGQILVIDGGRSLTG